MKYLTLLSGAGLFAISSVLFLHYYSQSDHKQPAVLSAVADDCSKQKGIAKVICLAEALEGSLRSEQLAALQLKYSKTDAARWSNFPASFRGAERPGLSFGSMDKTQIQYAKALVKEVAGTSANEGWDELQQLLNADDSLGAKARGSDYGAANYYIALLGTPATKGTFEIQFGGHHMAFANTYKDGVLTGATPSFRGVEPFGKFMWDGKSNQPMNQEQEALSAMLKGLTESELSAAKLNATFSDLLVGPRRDGAFPNTPSGIKCGGLTAKQKKLVTDAMATYVDDIDDADAAVFMKKYTSELNDTYISYSGTTGVTTTNDYVRIDGPSVWIEYSCQHGIVLPNPHPHSVWRDKTKDYGGN